MKINKLKLFSNLFLFMLVINIITIIVIWRHYENEKSPDKTEEQLGSKEFIINKLGFDEKQSAAFELLRQEHFNQLQKIQQVIRKEKQEMFDKLQGEKKDSTVALQHLSNVMIMEEQADKLTYDHFRKVRDLCNPAQKEIFDMVIQDVMKNKSGGTSGPLHSPPELHPPGGPHIPR
ncbi:MAG: hypothetical protein ACHQK8_02755 [Bacteroidia bacterium]